MCLCTKFRHFQTYGISRECSGHNYKLHFATHSQVYRTWASSAGDWPKVAIGNQSPCTKIIRGKDHCHRTSGQNCKVGFICLAPTSFSAPLFHTPCSQCSHTALCLSQKGSSDNPWTPGVMGWNMSCQKRSVEVLTSSTTEYDLILTGRLLMCLVKMRSGCLGGSVG